MSPEVLLWKTTPAVLRAVGRAGRRRSPTGRRQLKHCRMVELDVRDGTGSSPTACRRADCSTRCYVMATVDERPPRLSRLLLLLLVLCLRGVSSGGGSVRIESWGSCPLARLAERVAVRATICTWLVRPRIARTHIACDHLHARMRVPAVSAGPGRRLLPRGRRVPEWSADPMFSGLRTAVPAFLSRLPVREPGAALPKM